MIFIPYFLLKSQIYFRFFILYPLERPAQQQKTIHTQPYLQSRQGLALNKPTFLKKGVFARSTQLLIIFIMLIKVGKNIGLLSLILFIRFFCFIL